MRKRRRVQRRGRGEETELQDIEVKKRVALNLIPRLFSELLPQRLQRLNPQEGKHTTSVASVTWKSHTQQTSHTLLQNVLGSSPIFQRDTQQKKHEFAAQRTP